MYEEGLAKIDETGAFLNPYSRFSRDISVAVLSMACTDAARVLDATAATGIRGIRYFKELGFRDITFLDINKECSESIKRNTESNMVSGDGIKVYNLSIQEFANTSKDRFDVIDLDPFGGPVPDIADLMRLVRDGGLFMVSATDTAVLCGAQPNACIRNYGSLPLHDELCHESSIRILIGYVARVAAQYNFGIEPIYSVVHMHFVRVILRLRKGASNADRSLKEMGFAYHCKRCGWISYSKGLFPTLDNCDICGKSVNKGGIMWMGRMYDKEVKEYVYDYFKRMEYEGLNAVAMIRSELDEFPFYYNIPTLTRIMHMAAVSPYDVICRLNDSGFKASMTHMERESIRSDAGINDVKRCIETAMGRVRD
jgi:tRNA (guanine26-N2/guanine27-N2)-dimethyltransferase